MTNVFQFHITKMFLVLDFQWTGVCSKGWTVVSKEASGCDIFVAYFPFEVSYRDGIDGDLFSSLTKITYHRPLVPCHIGCPSRALYLKGSVREMLPIPEPFDTQKAVTDEEEYQEPERHLGREPLPSRFKFS